MKKFIFLPLFLLTSIMHGMDNDITQRLSTFSDALTQLAGFLAAGEGDGGGGEPKLYPDVNALERLQMEIRGKTREKFENEDQLNEYLKSQADGFTAEEGDAHATEYRKNVLTDLIKGAPGEEKPKGTFAGISLGRAIEQILRDITARKLTKFNTREEALAYLKSEGDPQPDNGFEAAQWEYVNALVKGRFFGTPFKSAIKILQNEIAAGNRKKFATTSDAQLYIERQDALPMAKEGMKRTLDANELLSISLKQDLL
jgi:hypothetical protein